MTWPEAFVTATEYICWTFIVWRAGAGMCVLLRKWF